MNLTYNNKAIATVRTSVKEDCIHIAANMRRQDAMEAWSACRYSPIDMAMSSFNNSIISMTIEKDGVPIAMFGLMPKESIVDTSVYLWLLTTDRIHEIGRIFVRNSKQWINKMLEGYSSLEGCVDCRNVESINWLTFIGAQWSEPEAFGVDQVPFKRFVFKRVDPFESFKAPVSVIKRETILDIEKKISELPNAKFGDYLPLRHSFAEGMYVRELTIPKGELIVGKIHKKSNPVFIIKGDISIMSEQGITRFKAPCYLISQPGAKRIGYAHEETVWIEVFASKETDLVKLEEEIISKDFPPLTGDEHKFINSFVGKK